MRSAPSRSSLVHGSNGVTKRAWTHLTSFVSSVVIVIVVVRANEYLLMMALKMWVDFQVRRLAFSLNGMYAITPSPSCVASPDAQNYLIIYHYGSTSRAEIQCCNRTWAEPPWGVDGWPHFILLSAVLHPRQIWRLINSYLLFVCVCGSASSEFHLRHRLRSTIGHRADAFAWKLNLFAHDNLFDGLESGQHR